MAVENICATRMDVIGISQKDKDKYDVIGNPLKMYSIFFLGTTKKSDNFKNKFSAC